MVLQLAAACVWLLAGAEASQPGGAGAEQPHEVAEEPAPAPPSKLASGATGVAPVELIPRLELRHLYARLPAGASATTTTVRMDVDFLGRLLLRYELPFRRLANATGEQVSGLGDIQLEAFGVLTAGPRQVLGLLAGVQLDSATQPQLGLGKQVLELGAAGALKFGPWLPYLVLIQQLSVAGDDTRPDVNRLNARLGNILFGPGFAWLKLDVDTLIDFHDEGTTRLFAALEAGRLLIGSVGVFVRGGTQAIGPRELDYSVEAGARYLFRLGTKAPP
jgi:hypothetical protein